MREKMIFETGTRLRFVGDGTGRNCIDGHIGLPDDRVAIDFRNKVGTIVDDRDKLIKSSVMTVGFDGFPHTFTMAKDADDFELAVDPADLNRALVMELEEKVIGTKPKFNIYFVLGVAYIFFWTALALSGVGEIPQVRDEPTGGAFVFSVSAVFAVQFILGYFGGKSGDL